MAPKITPNRGNVLIRRDSIGEEADGTTIQVGSLFIPKEAQNRLKDNHTAEILAIGENRISDTGYTFVFPFQVGDRVIVSPYSGTVYKFINEDGDQDQVEIIEQGRIVGRID